MPPKYQLIDVALLETTLARARTTPRLRTNHNFHENDAANPHRFLNAMLRGTYCTPHRHSEPPKSESFLVLRGVVVVFLFDEEGSVTSRHVLGVDGVLGIDIPAGVWHSVAVLSASAVVFEVKPGPYLPTNDKEFAAWAPPEGDERAPAYLAGLLASVAAPELVLG